MIGQKVGFIYATIGPIDILNFFFQNVLKHKIWAQFLTKIDQNIEIQMFSVWHMLGRREIFLAPHDRSESGLQIWHYGSGRYLELFFKNFENMKCVPNCTIQKHQFH